MADTSASPADTLHYVADGRPPSVTVAAVDCNGNPAPAIPAADLPVIEYDELPPGTDLRDVLDRGIPGAGAARADLVFTRDPGVLAYAARRDDYRAVALPWDRTYALVVPNADSTAPPDSVEREALARDAVRSDARGAAGPFWWQGDTTCNLPAPGAAALPVVGFAAGDSIGRELAERIVALATSPGRPAWIPPELGASRRGPLRTAPMAADSLGEAIASGRVAAAVLAYPRIRPPGCDAARRTPAGAATIPLIDSRAHVLIRRGSGAAFYIVTDGSIRVMPSERR
ncbi:MAG: hypothetical protein WBQ26_15125 [Gemmatimonadaceae bacterium]|nr:hypothetical protein [Gemmatimonadaceae bacterium]